MKRTFKMKYEANKKHFLEGESPTLKLKLVARLQIS